MGLPFAWETLQRYEASPWGWRSRRSTYSARRQSAISRASSWRAGRSSGFVAKVVRKTPFS